MIIKVDELVWFVSQCFHAIAYTTLKFIVNKYVVLNTS